jgi:protein O-GlcNAc transferase
VDNFSEFDPRGDNRRILGSNLARLGLTERVRFADQNFERYFVERREREGPPVGVYLYDGAHDYRSQLLGLLLAVPFLADRALVVVDDANWIPVRQAISDFLTACPQARLLLEVRTPGNGHPDFWNGLQVLSWEDGQDNG